MHNDAYMYLIVAEGFGMKKSQTYVVILIMLYQIKLRNK